jgi:hypothetical protein
MLSRDVLDILLPEGAFWEPEAEDDYDNLLEGIAENTEAVRLDMDALRNIRNPWMTPMLTDLELEFAVTPISGATEAERRERLAVVMYQRGALPTYEFLQGKLRAAGFDVYVYPNSPAVDPRIFLNEAFNMVCGDLLPGGNDAQCGEAEAICAKSGGELLVNGDLMENRIDYLVICDEALAQCGEATALAGNFSGYVAEPVETAYEVPADSGYWPLVFFVGGQATFDPVTGEITDIIIASIPQARRTEFRRIILQLKPMFSWAALICVYS